MNRSGYRIAPNVLIIPVDDVGPGTPSTCSVEINTPGERIATFDNEGTAYPEDVSLEANAKNLKVSMQNPGYRKTGNLGLRHDH